MLAQNYWKHKNKVKYPCIAQPKIDGVRCIAELDNGKCTLFTRTGKKITSLPHLVKTFEENSIGETIIYDGELYSPSLSFEKLVGLINRKEPDKLSRVIEYYMFDIVYLHTVYEERRDWVYFRQVKRAITAVMGRYVQNEKDLLRLYQEHLSHNWEGTIIRNVNGEYEQKRSFNLLKMKPVLEKEFKIVGYVEGKGKIKGQVGSVQCITKEGRLFSVKLSRLEGESSEVFVERCKTWAEFNNGKMLTVQYQNLTANGIPRFPIGKGVRDYE